jgi:CRISPR-associated protein Cas6
MTTVDLLFPVRGGTLPTDHHYPLFAALSRLVPWLHDATAPVAVAPINGNYGGDGQLRIDPSRSRLRFRLRVEDLPRLLPLAGKRLDVMGHAVRLGVPHVMALEPAAELLAHTVFIKNAVEPAAFVAAARKKLDDLGVAGQAELPVIPSGPRKGEPQRKVLRVKKNVLVCYPLWVRGLTAAESLRLQEAGLGGRRRMGGGFFIPARGAGVADE